MVFDQAQQMVEKIGGANSIVVAMTCPPALVRIGLTYLPKIGSASNTLIPLVPPLLYLLSQKFKNLQSLSERVKMTIVPEIMSLYCYN